MAPLGLATLESNFSILSSFLLPRNYLPFWWNLDRNHLDSSGKHSKIVKKIVQAAANLKRGEILFNLIKIKVKWRFT
jgi:hypothetical protein